MILKMVIYVTSMILIRQTSSIWSFRNGTLWNVFHYGCDFHVVFDSTFCVFCTTVLFLSYTGYEFWRNGHAHDLHYSLWTLNLLYRVYFIVFLYFAYVQINNICALHNSKNRPVNIYFINLFSRFIFASFWCSLEEVFRVLNSSSFWIVCQ